MGPDRFHLKAARHVSGNPILPIDCLFLSQHRILGTRPRGSAVIYSLAKECLAQVDQQEIKSGEQPAKVVEMRTELARKIAAHIHAAGEQVTAVPGLTLYRRTAPTLVVPPRTSPA
jgi:hypothetical protein